MDRIWIYMADRALAEAEVKAVESRLSSFVERWTAHGKKLRASFELRFNRFIVLKVQDGFSEASGCSIDDSVRFLREIEKEFKLSLFDRSQVAFLKNNEVNICALKELKALYGRRELSDDTLVFDNTITTGEEYRSLWQKPLRASGYFAFVK